MGEKYLCFAIKKHEAKRKRDAKNGFTNQIKMNEYFISTQKNGGTLFQPFTVNKIYFDGLRARCCFFPCFFTTIFFIPPFTENIQNI